MNESTLGQLLDDLSRSPFPEGSDDEEVAALHAELADYDGYVVGLAQRIERGESMPASSLKSDPSLHQKLERIVLGRSNEASKDATRLVKYLAKLEKVVEAANAVLRGHVGIDRRDSC